MRILVALDLSDATESILAVARRAAKASNASIILLHVAPPDPAFVGYEPGPQTVRDQVAHDYRDQHRTLHTLAEELNREGIETTALLIQESCQIYSAGSGTPESRFHRHGNARTWRHARSYRRQRRKCGHPRYDAAGATRAVAENLKSDFFGDRSPRELVSATRRNELLSLS